MQILRRADNPRDFIRKGTNEAITEITLSSGNPQRPIVIQRRLTKDSTRYRINGEAFLMICVYFAQLGCWVIFWSRRWQRRKDL